MPTMYTYPFHVHIECEERVRVISCDTYIDWKQIFYFEALTAIKKNNNILVTLRPEIFYFYAHDSLHCQELDSSCH